MMCFTHFSYFKPTDIRITSLNRIDKDILDKHNQYNIMFSIRQKDKLGNHFTHEKIIKVNNDLLDWVKSLPNINNYL